MPGAAPAAGHAAMASALRREAAALADGRRVARELEAAQALAAEREADNQRLRMIVKLKEGMVARLEVCPAVRPDCLSCSKIESLDWSLCSAASKSLAWQSAREVRTVLGGVQVSGSPLHHWQCSLRSSFLVVCALAPPMTVFEHFACTALAAHHQCARGLRVRGCR